MVMVVLDEQGRLSEETMVALERVFADRPELLGRFLDGMAGIFREGDRRRLPADLSARGRAGS